MNTTQWIMAIGCAISVITFLGLTARAYFSSGPSSARWPAVGSAGTLALSLIVGSAGDWPTAAATIEITPASEAPVGKPVASRPTASVTNPLEVAAMCVIVTGTYDDPDDTYRLAVASRQVSDTRYYFEGLVSLDPTKKTWSATLSLGTVEDKVTKYQIVPVFVPKDLHQYLIHTSETETDTYWSSNDLPPGSIQGSSVIVTRTDDNDC